MIKPICAYVKYPNTPESDMQRRVVHVVEGVNDNGQVVKINVMAEDPIDAIEKSRTASDICWSKS
jgi:hypothetical protein